jgi:hypothetical protein
MVFKVGAIAGVDYGISVPFQVNVILPRALNLGGYKIRIGKNDADRRAFKILSAANPYFLAYAPAKPVKL